MKFERRIAVNRLQILDAEELIMQRVRLAHRSFTGTIFLLACLITGLTSVAAETPRSATGRDHEARANSVKKEVQVLKEQLALQQEQINRLRAGLEEQRRLIEQLVQTTEGNQLRGRAGQPSGLGEVASVQPAIPSAASQPAAVSNGARFGNVDAIRSSPDSASRGNAQYPATRDSQAEGKKPSPLSIRIGDADFTIGGFMDFTALFRSNNVGSGIGTTFGAIPFSNTPQGRLSETRLTAQNSRVSLTATSQVGENNVKGYIEADFLGVQPANGFVTSNSNSLRMRLYWLQLVRSKFELLAGQSWSMLNPNRVGLSPLPGDIFYSQNMDTNYQVGLTWARQAQVRFIYHPSPEWAAGISLENPQQFVGGAVLLPGGFDSKQVDTVGNPLTPNLHPDIIPKVAYDGKVGYRALHVEVAGLLSSFRVFNQAQNSSSTVTGGGGSVNANLELVKNFHLILNTFYSDGGGRYIFGLGPDLVVRPDTTPSLVHAGSGIAGFEWQVNPKSMLYGYYGGAYYQRNTAIDPATRKFLGFGFPGSSDANRSIQEGTFGLIQTFWKNPRYGALQLITQYSYLTRTPWSVATGAPKNAHTSLGYVDVRYVLP